MPRRSTGLNHKQIRAAVWKRLKKYEKLSFLEEYAMFMGMAQVLELSLKQLANRLYKIPFEKLERKTLGTMARLFRERKLRVDFLFLFDSVVEHRNHIAHDLLASQFILILLGAGDARFERRILDRGIYEVEQLYFLFEWNEKHRGWWGPDERVPENTKQKQREAEQLAAWTSH